VMPILRRECGGAPDLPICGIDFSPQPLDRKTPASV
jgi:hypothetical protein